MFLVNGDGKRYKGVDEVSDLIRDGRIPSASQIRNKFGNGLDKVFWVTSPPIYGIEQRAGWPIARHAYDLSVRPKVRDLYEVTDEEIAVGLGHDLPEDILKKAKHEKESPKGIRRSVGALVMLDILSSITSSEIAYGKPFPGANDGKKIYGGVISETNFNSLIAEPVIGNNVFSSRIGEPKFYLEDKDGVAYAHLTDHGRKVFLEELAKIYERMLVRTDEILRAYSFIKGRYITFVEEHLPASGLTEAEQREIAGEYISPIIATIDDKINGEMIYSPREIREEIRARYKHVVSLVSNDKRTGADSRLILTKESPQDIVLEKILYTNYIHSMVAQVYELVQYAIQSNTPFQRSYMQSPMTKLEDILDIVALLGPNLDNITSQHRKARIIVKHDASLLQYLNEVSIFPREDGLRFYAAINETLKKLRFQVKKKYRDFKGEEDTGYDEHKTVLGIMKDKLKDLESTVSGSKPPSESLMRRLVSSAGIF